MQIIILFLSILFLSGCEKKDIAPHVYQQSVMNTMAEISLWDDGEEPARTGFREMERLEELFSRFKAGSDISRINKSLSAKVSKECVYLVKKSMYYAKLTGGAFDVTKKGAAVVVDGNTISIGKETELDLGGIAKGYAVDRVVGILKRKKVDRAMVNLGGNFYLIGYPPGKRYWVVGIKNPLNPEKLIGRLRLETECGVATSGNYERPGHIMNPKTGKSADSVLSVTIVAPTALEADALSTGVFVLGREMGAELVEKLPGVEGVIIDNNAVWVSSGLKDKFVK